MIPPTNVATALQTPNDMPILFITGQVKQQFKRVAGDNAKGPYSFEHIILADTTGEIKVTFKDFPPLPQIKGASLVLQAKQGDKGITGVKASEDEYQGKVTKIIWVTPSATVLVNGQPINGGVQQSAPQAPQSSPFPPAQPAPVQKPAFPPMDFKAEFGGTPAPAAPADTKAMAERALAQYAGLYERCMDAAVVVGSNVHGKVDLSSTDVKDIATTFFIQLTRQGYGPGFSLKPKQAAPAPADEQF